MLLEKLFSKNKNKIKRISYFGFADTKPGDELFNEVFECAKFIAGKGFETVNGGGPGVMRASTDGARSVGGKVIGVTFYPKDITNFEGRDKGNILDKEIKKTNYLERTLKLLEMGDAYIIFRGGTGTISEFGMAWGLARLYFGKHKPLILYGNFWENVIRAFVDNMRIRSEEMKTFKIVNSPEEAYQAILGFEQSIKENNNKSKEEQAFQQ
jgi:predicted Rossmann-fold nucleotide-binding protein